MRNELSFVSGRRLVRRKQHRPRHGDADLSRQRVVEEFFVGAPPERIIHDCGAGERCILQPGAIKRHVLRDAIDDHVVTARLALNHLVDSDEFRDDVFAAGFLIHPLDECRWKTVFLTKKNSDFFHNSIFVISSGAKP